MSAVVQGATNEAAVPEGLPLPEMEHIICQLERGTVVRRSLCCPKILIEEPD